MPTPSPTGADPSMLRPAVVDAYTARSSPRHLRIDALRGLAVFGILLVNIWSFVWGFEVLRYGFLPDPAPLADRAAVFFTAMFAEQKFYPIFAFLFGAGFALHTRGLRRRFDGWRAVRKIYRRRLLWLIGAGVLHGTLIWFGDILTLYGIAGFLIIGLAGARLRTVRRFLFGLLLVWVVLMATNLAGAWGAADPEEMAYLGRANAEESAGARAVYTGGSIAAIARHRVSDYIAVSGQSVLLVPHLLVLFLLGIYAVRSGWLTRPARHRRLWSRVRLAGYTLGLAFNTAWALSTTAEVMEPLFPPDSQDILFALLPLGGSLLAAAYVASFMLAEPSESRLQAWLAPVGRMALSNYILQSILCAALLQAAGLGLGARLSHAGVLLMAFGIIAFQLLASRWWLARFRQGPLEVLYRQFAESGARVSQAAG